MNSTTNKTTISVILPLYNAEKSICKALDSIQTQIGNWDFEIIVINDGSTDSSLSLVQKYAIRNPTLNIKIITQNNRGVSVARNIGLKIAKGEYIALLDSDDVWFPEKTIQQMALFTSNNTLDLLATKRVNQTILFPYTVKNEKAKITFFKLLIRNEVQPSTLIFKKEKLRKVGLFDENKRYAEDHHFLLKFSKFGTMYILDKTLVLAGDGKRTFGYSGLSSNLFQMKLGFKDNLKYLHKKKYVNFIFYLFLVLFYELKYLILLIRNWYYTILR